MKVGWAVLVAKWNEYSGNWSRFAVHVIILFCAWIFVKFVQSAFLHSDFGEEGK